jgi:hypothetical protein
VSGASGLQIGGIDQGQGQIFARAAGQQRFQQLVVDLAQPADPTPFPKLVQHPDVGHLLPIGQVGEATPSSLLDQQRQQVVESVDRCQNAQ